jgi:hypothetical protein
MNERATSGAAGGEVAQNIPHGFFLDVLLFLSVMFAVRAIHLPGVGFLGNGLFWSCTVLCVATWRIRARGFSWSDLGLRRPESIKGAIVATVFILALVPISIIVFELVKDQLPFGVAPDTSNEEAVSKFGDLRGNWSLLLSIIPLVWIESMLEELLDRGFLINWLERAFARVSFATVLAVLLQAAIFGFRHSYDLSSRSITAGLIGLVMGIAYVAFGRNLWPVIAAHCILTSMSMLDRVL